VRGRLIAVVLVAAAALAIVDGLAGDPSIAGYRFLHSTRAELLRRLGRAHDALAAYDRALALSPNEAEAAFLRARRQLVIAGSTAG